MFEEVKRTLGLDIGRKRTGIAIADETLTIATPLTHIEAHGLKDWLQKLLLFLENYPIEQIIVGIPLNHHGEIGKVGGRVTASVLLSLCVLIVIAVALIYLLQIA